MTAPTPPSCFIVSAVACISLVGDRRSLERHLAFLVRGFRRLHPELSDEQLDGLLTSDSWKGKAGGYDLHGPMGEYARLAEGAESTVLGFAGEAMAFLETWRQLADAHSSGVKPNSCFCMSTTTFCPGIMSSLSSASSEKTLTRAWSAMCLISLDRPSDDFPCDQGAQIHDGGIACKTRSSIAVGDSLHHIGGDVAKGLIGNIRSWFSSTPRS